ncbi:MAG: iron ABC transporter permease [Puniceicoccaceae bacterium]|nr:MAG: iron ABC transporter permease [Puniceicoccaceae bacterium]
MSTPAPLARTSRRTRPVVFFPVLLLLLAAASLLSLSHGAFGTLGPRAWLALLTGPGPLFGSEDLDTWHEILRHVRLPRLTLALLVGANLGVAGALMQTLFLNPMAEPYVVGVASGAAFGAVAALSLGLGMGLGAGGLSLLSLAAFAGAFATTGIVYTLARRTGRASTGTLLLTGIAVGGFLQALTTLLLLHTEADQIRSILGWLMGGLAHRDWSYALTLLPWTVLGLTAALIAHRPLDALAGGEDLARSQGLGVPRFRLLMLLTASLLAASAVAAAGIIAFAGLIVPHCCRGFLGPGHRLLLPASALGGALLLVIADILARSLLPGEEIPIGILTGLAGCLFFLYLLRRPGRVF